MSEPRRDNPWLERRVVAYAHQGGAWESPSSTLHAIDAALAGGRHGDRARRARHVGPSPRGLPRRDGGPHDRRRGPDLRPDPRRARWRSTTRTGGHPARTSRRASTPRRTRCGAARRAEHDFGIATLAEVLERFPSVPVNLDIKRTAPDVEPYEELLAEELRRFERGDDVIVASFSDPAIAAFRAAAPEFATSLATLETAEFYRAAKTGGAMTATHRRGASRSPRRSASSRSSTSSSSVARTKRGSRCTSGRSTKQTRCAGSWHWASTGSSRTSPSVLVGVLEDLGCAWGGTSGRAG